MRSEVEIADDVLKVACSAFAIAFAGDPIRNALPEALFMALVLRLKSPELQASFKAAVAADAAFFEAIKARNYRSSKVRRLAREKADATRECAMTLLAACSHDLAAELAARSVTGAST